MMIKSLALFSRNASFAYDFKVDGINYKILSKEDLTCEVTKGKKYSGDIVIPSTVTYRRRTFSVTDIGQGAFYECSSLTSITIPNSVTSIGGEAFNFCKSLASVISKMKNPCYLDYFCFSDEVFEKAKLYVPKGTIGLYNSKRYWNEFTSIVEGDGPNA